MAKISKAEYEILKGLDNQWRWIARDSGGDHGGNLFAYSEKPFKIYDVGEWDCGIGILFIGTCRFQFIRWEDEEPHNIAELVEEYESEEIEVKKDKEWLVQRIQSEREQLAQSFAEGEETDDESAFNDGKDKALSSVLRLIKQLDEPEVLSQELPVIPKFVANWIEGNKQLEEMWNDYSKEDAMNDIIHFTIYGLFADYPATNSHVELRKPVLKWLGDDRGNYFKLVNAVRYGYELEEEEQKYYARIKGWKNITTGSEAFNWVYFKEKDTVGISKAVENKYQAVSFTKHDWNNLGINEHNADFVLVEEVE